MAAEMSKNVYLFSGESYMINKSLSELKNLSDVQFAEINITEYKTMPKADDLIGACYAVPFMSEKRLVAVTDCTVLNSKGGADEQRKIADAIPKMPESTILVLCTTEAIDKRKALFIQIKKFGIIKEFSLPDRLNCIEFVAKKAKENGADISKKAAEELVAAVGCDYYSLENEIAKLAVYCGFKEITNKHIAECVSKSLEFNVFEIHGMLIKKQAENAKTLLEDILKVERPEGLIGLIARKIRDMYKVKTMIEAGYKPEKIAELLGMKSFAAEMAIKECRQFTQQELRGGLLKLADLDYGIKSGEKDASLALPEVIFEIYKL